MNYLQEENIEEVNDIKLYGLNSTIGPPFKSGYCPISHKEKMNPPDTNYLDGMSNTDIFLSKKNIHYMTYFLVAMCKKNMTGTNPGELAPLVPTMMIEWSKKNTLDDFEYIYDDILLTLEFLNKKFITNHACVYGKNDNSSINVFRAKGAITVDECGNEETKKYSEMTAENYKNMDVWQDTQEYTYDKRNRYDNSIPIWQRSMNIRQYEHVFDGLHTSNPTRASLDTQLRGYNMSNIIKGSEFYKQYDYAHN
jgi:hypothetical protein